MSGERSAGGTGVTEQARVVTAPKMGRLRVEAAPLALLRCFARGVQPPPMRPGALPVTRMIKSGSNSRRGFTMIEVLIAVAIVAILVAVVVPKIGEISAKAALRSARMELTTAFAAGRSAAFQKGKTATLTLASNTANVTVLSGLNANAVQVFGPIRFNSAFKVTVSAIASAPTTVFFDARGLVTPAVAGISKYQLVRGTYADTVCISAAGIILPRSCQL